MKRLHELGLLSARKRTKRLRGSVPTPPDAQDEDPPPFGGTLALRTVTEVYHAAEGTALEGFLRFKVIMRWTTSDKHKVLAEAREGATALRFDMELKGACHDYFVQNHLAFDVGDVLCASLKGSQVQRRPTPNSSLSLKWTTLPMTIHYQDGVLLQFVESRDATKLAAPIDTRPARGEIPQAPLAPDDWFSTPVSQHGFTPPLVHTDSQPSHSQHPEPTLSTDTHEAVAHRQSSTGLVGLDAPSIRVEPLPNVLDGRKPTSADQEITVASPSAASPPRPKRSKELIPEQAVPPASLVERPLYRKDRRQPREQPGNESKKAEKLLPEQDLQRVQYPGASAHGHKKAAKKARREVQKLAVSGIVSEPDSGPSNGDDLEIQRAEVTTTNPTPQAEAVLSAQSRSEGAQRVYDGDAISKAAPPHKSILISAIAPVGRSSGTPSPSAVETSSKVPRSTKTPDTLPSNLLPVQPDHDPALDLQAGCYSEESMTTYVPLRDLVKGKKQNFVGVVISAQTKPTAMGQTMTRLLLQDPSIYTTASNRDFGVNCFTAAQSDNICGARKGDIVLLRCVEINENYGYKMGVGGSLMPWSWALFSPANGSIASANETSRMIFKPTQAELSYCIKLGDWWRAVEEHQEKDRRENGDVVHDLADIYGSRRTERVHRLLIDASPTAPPNGFFDCTVEVLKTHHNDHDIWSVYVTDYTSNTDLPVVDASWSDSSLANRILKVEMWDSAAEVASKMQSGEYFSIRNMKMRVSSGGYWEGKHNDGRKIRKLDDDELEDEPHLQALLRRKREWQDQVLERGDEERFCHTLFQEASLEEHFNCTVQVLHLSLKENDRAFIYVTDYTPRKNLANLPPTAHWIGNISDDRIIKIALSGAPAHAAESLQGGDYVALRKLRLIAAKNNGEQVSGRLGGDEELIIKLNPVETGNSHLMALLRRQRQWEKTVNSVLPAPRGSSISKPKTASTTPKYKELGAFTIKEIQNYDGPPALLEPVVARIVDFWPEHLVDCVVLRCTLCNEEIPENLNICTRCDDNMETHVRPVYRFSFEIEDENDDRMRLYAAHPDCSLLKDLPVADLREDSEALEAFTERLRPVLGRLIDEHSRLVENAQDGQVRPDWDQPLLKMSIGKVTSEGEPSTQIYLLEADPIPPT